MNNKQHNVNWNHDGTKLIHTDTPRDYKGKALVNYKSTLTLSPAQKEMLSAILLGDGYIGYNRTTKRPCYYVVFAQKKDRADYVDHVYQILKPFVGSPPKMNLIGGIKPGLPKRYDVRFRTYSHAVFKPFYDLYYSYDPVLKTRPKRVPHNIAELLTPRALAYWYMDDGSRGGTGLTSCYNFSTHCYPLDDVDLLRQALVTNFGIQSRVYMDKGMYRLYTKAQSQKAFKRVVEPYMHACFHYKL